MFDTAAYLNDGLELAGWTAVDLWLAAYALGGDLDFPEIEGAIVGLRPPGAHDYDALVLAFNERFLDRGLDRPMLYWDELPAL
jgi:hypothetical protein